MCERLDSVILFYDTNNLEHQSAGVPFARCSGQNTDDSHSYSYSYN